MSGSEHRDPGVAIATPLTPQHATAVSVAVNNSDIVLVFMVMQPHFGTSGLVPQMTVAPVSAISLAPVAAKQLVRQISQAIESFETATTSTVPDVGDISVQEPTVERETS